MTDSQKLKELRKVFDYFRHDIISDKEAVRHVVEVLPTDSVNTVLAEIPETLLDSLKTFLASAPKSDRDWSGFEGHIIDGDEDSIAQLRRTIQANTEVLRRHLEMESSL